MTLEEAQKAAERFTEPMPGRPTPRFVIALAVAIGFVKSGARVLRELDDEQRDEVFRLCAFHECQDRAYWLIQGRKDWRAGTIRDSMSAAVDQALELRDTMAAVTASAPKP